MTEKEPLMSDDYGLPTEIRAQLHLRHRQWKAICDRVTRKVDAYQERLCTARQTEQIRAVYRATVHGKANTKGIRLIR